MEDKTVNRTYDFVVWGATGFTGTLVARYIARNYGGSGDVHKYAIAARDRKRLEKVFELMRDEYSATHGKNVATTVTNEGGPGIADKAFHVDRLVASVDDETSIYDLCKKSRCIISLAGPYAKVGEVVIKACADCGTNYVDVTGEIGWAFKMREKYNKQALISGAKIIFCCGYDFVPNDVSMGYIYDLCEKDMKARLLRLDQYFDMNMYTISGGTLRTILNEIKDMSIMRNIFQAKNKDGEPIRDAPYRFVRYDDKIQSWISPSIFSTTASSFLRWSNGVQPVPRNATHRLMVFVSQKATSCLSALSQFITLRLTECFLYILSKIPRAQSLLPRPGGAITLGSGNDTVRLISHATTDKGSVDCVFESPGIGPYDFTALSCVEGAISSITGESKKGGVFSPSGLGKTFEERLCNKGVTIKRDGR